MSGKIFARFLAAAKIQAKDGCRWSLKNQTLVGAIGGTAILVWDNKRTARDVKNEVRDVKTDSDQKHRESRRYFDEKFAILYYTCMETQRLILTSACSTMKGFQGDTTEIGEFIKSVEVFEKAGMRQGGWMLIET